MSCKFCGSKKIRKQRYIGSMPEVDRVSGKPVTDWCCRAQKENQKYKKKFI